jgi:hypothetical protein
MKRSLPNGDHAATSRAAANQSGPHWRCPPTPTVEEFYRNHTLPAEPDPAIIELARALARQAAREDFERAVGEQEASQRED